MSAYADRPLDAPEARRALDVAEKNRDVLESAARFALRRGENGETTVLVCLEVDSDWRWLVDQLMPDVDWEPLRAHAARSGGKVMAAGRQPLGRLVTFLAEHGIEIAAKLRDPVPPPGSFWVLVCLGETFAMLQIALRTAPLRRWPGRAPTWGAARRRGGAPS